MKPPTQPCTVCGKPSTAPLCSNEECLRKILDMKAKEEKADEEAKADRAKEPKE